MQQSARLDEVFARWWRKIAADECPEARRQRLLREHLDDINQGIAVFEARRLRELADESRKVIKGQVRIVAHIVLDEVVVRSRQAALRLTCLQHDIAPNRG